jgi:glycosyltransferase involved in cell wall biosynthesis
VVFTGTLTPKKGVVSLIDAWPQIARECPTAELHLYGKDGKTADGEPMQAHLQSRLPGDVASRVTFHGHVSRPKVLEALRTARVAVFPSYSEAFGLAPVEAMSCGCPTIYSMCGPGREIGEDGRDLLLIDPANPADIARAVARVLSSDELAGTLSLNGWQRVQNAFLLERQVEQNVEFYTQCCNQFHGLQCA